MAKYVYPAIIIPNSLGGFFADFPDVSGAFTDGKDLADVLDLAQEALGLMLYTYETERPERILPPTPIKELEVPENGFATYVWCDTKIFAENAQGETSYKKTTEGEKTDILGKAFEVSLEELVHA